MYVLGKAKITTNKPILKNSLILFIVLCGMDPEVDFCGKCVDTYGNLITFSPSGSSQLMNGLSFGTDNNNRVGRKIWMKYLHIKGIIQASTVGTVPSDQFVRVMCVYDLTPNGAAFAKADLLQNVTQSGGTSSDGDTFLNVNNRGRFRILLDQMWAMPIQTGITFGSSTYFAMGAPTVQPLDLVIIVDEEAVYNGGDTGTISDINSGALYMFGVNRTATSYYQLDFTSRLEFSDI